MLREGGEGGLRERGKGEKRERCDEVAHFVYNII